MLILSAFMAGLMGSPHCIGMCGGFASACARPLRGSVAWHAGRLSTYAMLGAIGGLTGRVIPGPAWVALVISALLLIWFAGVLAGALPQLSVGVPGITRAGRALIARADVPSRYLFGILTGMLPCGLVYAALSFALAAGTPLRGAVAMLAFGLATVPALALLTGVAHQFAVRSIWHRRTLAALVLVTGLWSIGTRAVRVYGDQPARVHSHQTN
jgi:sulfite exporter TauE/SafE